MKSHEDFFIIIFVSALQQHDQETDSDSGGEEPSPESIARYLQIRRHTLGVTDPKQEVRCTPDTLRVDNQLALKA